LHSESEWGKHTVIENKTPPGRKKGKTLKNQKGGIERTKQEDRKKKGERENIRHWRVKTLVKIKAGSTYAKRREQEIKGETLKRMKGHQR